MIIPDMSIDEYHAHSSLSTSKVKVFCDEGAEAFHRTFNLKTMPRPPKSHFAVGNGFECLVFDGQGAFDQRYACKPPDMSFASCDGKEWKAQVEATHTILEQRGIPDLASVFDDMLAAIHANPFATKLLASGKPQVTIRRLLEALGVEVQTRPDWLNLEMCAGITEGAYTVNLKTCADLDLYAKHCVGFGYHRQSALEQWLLAKEGIITEHFQLVVEKKRAPRCKVFRIPEKILSAGWDTMKRDIESIAARYKSGVWTEVQQAIEDVEIPVWEEKRLLLEAEEAA